MAKDIKKRYWEIIGYPDSLPENWKDILEKTGLSIAISPLHDSDVMDTGELKKAHYHILVVYNGPTSQNSVNHLSQALNAPLPQYKDNLKGAYEYHWHKNNPEKHQYDKRSEQFINNFDIRDYSDLTKSEIRKLKIEIFDLIRQTGMVEYSDLIHYLQDQELFEMFDFVTNNTVLYQGYFSSVRNMARTADTLPYSSKTSKVNTD